jgi:hypothetical protein
MTCHVEPFLKRMNICCSSFESRSSGGNASSIRRLPVCGLTAVQIALRACSYSGKAMPVAGYTFMRGDGRAVQHNIVLAPTSMRDLDGALAALFKIIPEWSLIGTRHPPVRKPNPQSGQSRFAKGAAVSPGHLHRQHPTEQRGVGFRCRWTRPSAGSRVSRPCPCPSWPTSEAAPRISSLSMPLSLVRHAKLS